VVEFSLKTKISPAFFVSNPQLVDWKIDPLCIFTFVTYVRKEVSYSPSNTAATIGPLRSCLHQIGGAILRIR
jgi:hypothetical protein